MLDSSGDEGNVKRIKETVEETKPSLANVMVSTNLSNGQAGWLTEKDKRHTERGVPVTYRHAVCSIR